MSSVVCPNCSVRHDVDDAILAASSGRFKCTNCGDLIVASDADIDDDLADVSSGIHISGVDGIAGLKGVTLLGAATGMAAAKQDRYYVQRQSGKVFGPFEKALIKQMISGQKLSGGEGVSTDKKVWIPILSIPDFASLFGQSGTSTGFSSGGLSSSSSLLDSSVETGVRPSVAGIPSDSPAFQVSPTQQTAPGQLDVKTGSDEVTTDSIRGSMDASVAFPPLPTGTDSLDESDLDLSDFSGLSGFGDGGPISQLFGEPSFGDDLSKPLSESFPAPKMKSRPSPPQIPKPPTKKTKADEISAILHSHASDLPELPVPKRAPYGSDLPELPALKTKPRSPELPELPARKTKPRGSELPELPLPKTKPGGFELPELPAPKAPLGGFPASPDDESLSLGAQIPARMPSGGSDFSEPVSQKLMVPADLAGAPLSGPLVASDLPELPKPVRRDPGQSSSKPLSDDVPELPKPVIDGIPELPRPKGFKRTSGTNPSLPASVGPVSRAPALPVRQYADDSGGLPQPQMVGQKPKPSLPARRYGGEGSLPLPQGENEQLRQQQQILPTRRLQEVDLPSPPGEGSHTGEIGEVTRKFESASLPGSDISASFGDLLDDSLLQSQSMPLPEISSDPLFADDTGGLPEPESLFPPGSQPLGMDSSSELDWDSGSLADETADGNLFPDESDDETFPETSFEDDSFEPPGEPASQEASKTKRGRGRGTSRTKGKKAGGKTKPKSTRKLMVLGAVVIIGAVIALVVPGLFGDEEEDGENVDLIVDDGRGTETEIVLAPTTSVELSHLQPGNYADYLSYLQDATHAADYSENEDLDAVANLVIGQALMRGQYGAGAAMTADMPNRHAALAEATEPLHRLAQGAFAASRGEVEVATELLENLESEELEAWVELFLGISQLENYNVRLEAYENALLTQLNVPAEVAPTDETTPDDTVGTDEAPTEELSPSDVELDGAEIERLETGSGDTEEPTELADGETSESGFGDPNTDLQPDGQEDDTTQPAQDVEELIEPLELPVLDEDSCDHFVQAFQTNPNLIPAAYFEGSCAETVGDQERAQRAYGNALANNAEHVPSVIGLAHALIRSGELSEAGVHLRVVTSSNALGSTRERSECFVLEGRLNLIQLDLEAAATSFEAAFSEDVSNQEALWNYSSLLLDLNQNDRAIEFLMQHISAETHIAEGTLALALNRVGHAYNLTGDERFRLLEDTSADLEAERVNHSQDARFPHFLGLVRQSQNRFDEAEQLFQESLEIDPDYREARISFARLAVLSNDYEQASDLLHEACLYGEPDSQLESTIGGLFVLIGEQAAAAEAFARAIEIDPYNMHARIELARYFVFEGSPEDLFDAIEQLRFVEDAEVDEIEIQALMAEASYRLGRFDEARSRMALVSEHGEGDLAPEYLYLLGRINFDAGVETRENGYEQLALEHFEAARDNFNRTYEEGADSYEARFWEARSLLALAQYDRAIPAFRRANDLALRDGVQLGEYHFYLGYSQELAGQVPQALEAYASIDEFDLRWALEHPEFFYHRGMLYSHVERYQSARRDLEWALILEREHAGAAWELGRIHELQQDWEMTIELWERSLLYEPNQARIHDRLAKVFLRLNRQDDALTHFETAVALGYGEVVPRVLRDLGFLYLELSPPRRQDALAVLTQYLEQVEPGTEEETEIQNVIQRLSDGR